MTNQYRGIWILAILFSVFVGSCSVYKQAVSTKRLVGLWESKVLEQGEQLTILLHLFADGNSTYQFISKAETFNDTGTWNYSDRILHEQYSDGSTGEGSIKWISKNKFEITIIDNGDPSYSGLKRVYKRKE
ncbi:MAG TPA: hypothetical protein ENK52_05605 [Saprospiraceae bacterium]|nr:hypothetical protein [Saprospiraceae bacterium]